MGRQRPAVAHVLYPLYSLWLRFFCQERKPKVLKVHSGTLQLQVPARPPQAEHADDGRALSSGEQRPCQKPKPLARRVVGWLKHSACAAKVAMQVATEAYPTASHCRWTSGPQTDTLLCGFHNADTLIPFSLLLLPAVTRFGFHLEIAEASMKQ